MIKLSRKQRELRQREDLILEATRDLLLDRGYHGLTMDRIAEAVEYSKGTIYQHFPCKEEVLTELGTRIFEKRLSMFARAVTFDGRPRERMVAIGEGVEIFVRLYPDDFRILQILKAEVITSKVSEVRLLKMEEVEYRVLEIMAGIVREAVVQGDLILPPDVAPEELPFALWSITDGAYGIILRGIPLYLKGIQEPFRSVMKACDVLGDGYGWRPLSTEWDYAAARRRMRASIFAEEMRELEDRLAGNTHGETKGGMPGAET
jgi:AcrR family transcriptional regulator